MREKKVETELNLCVESSGGWSVKIVPSVAGIPDRLVIMPGGRVFFVELKSPTGKVKPHQRVVHRKLEKLGLPVSVLSSPEQVRAWVASLVGA